jgi:raffinose/stachyose/melibiose transport system substrate-binding protein
MSREKFFNLVGLALLTGCFVFSMARVLGRRPAAATEDGKVVIRFAHWQLEGGLREAMDQLARDYEALHPELRVEQIAVPDRTYAQWVRTQLIGGTAPDIVQLGLGMDDEVVARFFTPISEQVERPNPYNRGGELEKVRWRATFIDDMKGGWSYRPNLLEYYGAPMSMFTGRVFYNRELWRRLLGDTPPPKTYEEFIELCERVRRESAAAGGAVLPVAGSRDNGPMLMYRLFSSQTQRLILELDREHTLRPEGIDIGLAFLRGEWGVGSRGYADGLAITRETGLQMQPGFFQLGRDDASFYFLQGRALMITTGSWDSPSFRAMSAFDIGVFAIPLPSAEHPRYGANVLGFASEASTGTGLSFGIVRNEARFARALDFLQFITSREKNAAFSKASGWLPSVAGVKPAAHIEPFVPIVDGYIAGFDPTLATLGAGTTLVVQRNLNLLVGRAGSVEAFQDRMRAELPAAVREDVGRFAHMSRLNLQRQDVILAGLGALAETGHEAAALRKLSEMLEAQNRAESRAAWIENRLAALKEDGGAGIARGP